MSIIKCTLHRSIVYNNTMLHDLLCDHLTYHRPGGVVSTGLVTFQNMGVGERRTGQIPLRIDVKSNPAIILALVTDFVQDHDKKVVAFGDLELLHQGEIIIRPPKFAAYYFPEQKDFYIVLQDHRTDGDPKDWTIRWWAISETNIVGTVDVTKPK